MTTAPEPLQPMRFSEWLAGYLGGALDSRLTAALNETADGVALLEKGGTVSLKLTLTPQGGGVVVTGKVSHAAPQPKESGQFFYVTDAGLSRRDPSQPTIPNFPKEHLQ